MYIIGQKLRKTALNRCVHLAYGFDIDAVVQVQGSEHIYCDFVQTG